MVMEQMRKNKKNEKALQIILKIVLSGYNN